MDVAEAAESKQRVVGLALGEDAKVLIMVESFLKSSGLEVRSAEDLPSLLLDLGMAEDTETPVEAIFFRFGELPEAELTRLITGLRGSAYGEKTRLFGLSPEWQELRLRMRCRVVGCDDLLGYPPEPPQIAQSLGLETAGKGGGDKASRREGPEKGNAEGKPDADPTELTGTVLIVDDASVARVGLRRILGDMGLSVLEAENGQEAFHMAVTKKLDLLVTDLLMPQVDGFSLMSRIRGAVGTATLPIIVVSGYGDRPRLVKALRSGANDFIVKPFLPEVVRQKTLKLLSGKSSGSAGSQLKPVPAPAPTPVPVPAPDRGGKLS
jgi:CheY-like chemotaxis protein